MNVIESFLCHTLSVTLAELPLALRESMMTSPFMMSTMPHLDKLLAGDPSILDDLWKFSVSLDIPHKLLFDSFSIQLELNQRPHRQAS